MILLRRTCSARQIFKSLFVAWNLPNGPHKGHLSDSNVFGAWLMSLFGLAYFSFPNRSMLIFTTFGHLFEDLFPTGKEEISGFILQDRPGMLQGKP